MNMLSQYAEVENGVRMSRSNPQVDDLDIQVAGGPHAAGTLPRRGTRQMRRLGIVMCAASALVTMFAALWIAMGF
jgi:hypothetical protein